MRPDFVSLGCTTTSVSGTVLRVRREELFGLQLQTGVCFTAHPPLGSPRKTERVARNGGKQVWTDGQDSQEDWTTCAHK